MSKGGVQFSSVRSEGGILTLDLLRRVAAGDRDLPGLDADSYHLGKHERIGEAVNRAWSRLLGSWESFKEALAERPETDLATGLTRDRWLLPLFQELGYGRLTKAQAVTVDGREYAISHSWLHSPIHLLGCRIDLGKSMKGVAGAAKASPHGLVQDFLNRSEDQLWGFVSNGYVLRVLRDHYSLTRQAYVEFDLQSIMEGEQYSEFLLLWLVCHQSRVEAEKPGECWLEKWFQLGRNEGVQALDKLRFGVEKAIAAFGAGFLRHRANRGLRDALESGALSTQDYYRELLRLVYRLIFLFVAEDRGALLDPSSTEDAKSRYLRYYGTRRYRELADKRRGSPHGDLWRGLSLVIERLDRGSPELALPALGSFLWSREAMPHLDGAELANDDLLLSLRLLCYVQEGKQRYPVNWRNLGAEELGSVYEALLELHPRLNKEAATFELDSAAGHERKTTGSYYTPTSLVDCLLDSALDPVLGDVAKKLDPERAILDLKVCDPACGSGHFLVAAARRIAKRLASVRSGDEEPSPEALQSALRDVVGRCLYGVDINPMAVELCKVSLWMEAIEPGKPLSFLDAHIQCGNALLSATPALLRKGIPDAAFKPIEGDDKKICSELKKRNKQERRGQRDFFAGGTDRARQELGELSSCLSHMDELNDSEVEGVEEKQATYAVCLSSPAYNHSKLLADGWCAAFVWKKNREAISSGLLPITEGTLRLIEREPERLDSRIRQEIDRLASEYQFFHWHIGYPGVFSPGSTVEKPATSLQRDIDGGFDVVLGNPPWEKIQPEETKFFADIRPDIATASGLHRKRMISHLASADSETWRKWEQYKRRVASLSHLLKAGNSLPLSVSGNLNLYRLFAELGSKLTSHSGWLGMVVQTGIATDAMSKSFLQEMLRSKRLATFVDFENKKKIFAAVHGQFRFALLVLRGRTSDVNRQAQFTWLAKDVSEIKDPERVVEFSIEDVSLFNPSSGTAPIFATRRDFRVSRKLYSAGRHIFASAMDRFAEVDFQGEFYNMTRDSSYFLDEPSSPDMTTLPLYEAKYIHQFDHRFAKYDGRSVLDSSSADKKNRGRFSSTRFFVSKKEVRERASKKGIGSSWLIGFRDISNATNERTSIVSLMPFAGVGNNINLIIGLTAQQAVLVLGTANSFVFDYACRQKMSGTHLNIWIFKQLPLLKESHLKTKVPWGTELVQEWLNQRVLEVAYTNVDLQPFAHEVGFFGPPYTWCDSRRFLIRAELDAAFFHFFGIARDDVGYVMETFPIVKRKDEKIHGEYRTKRVILEIYDAMQEAIDTGVPYQTVLDPPPGDPRAAHPEESRSP